PETERSAAVAPRCLRAKGSDRKPAVRITRKKRPALSRPHFANGFQQDISVWRFYLRRPRRALRFFSLRFRAGAVAGSGQLPHDAAQPQPHLCTASKASFAAEDAIFFASSQCLLS